MFSATPFYNFCFVNTSCCYFGICPGHYHKFTAFPDGVNYLISLFSLIFLASQFHVICNNDDITIIADRSNLPKSMNVNGLHLLDSRCRANYNQTHVFVKTSLTGCGTRYEETDQTMFFSNVLSEEPYLVTSGVITRNQLVNINFTCSYGRKRTVGSISFQPSRQRLSVSLSK